MDSVRVLNYMSENYNQLGTGFHICMLSDNISIVVTDLLDRVVYTPISYTIDSFKDILSRSGKSKVLVIKTKEDDLVDIVNCIPKETEELLIVEDSFIEEGRVRNNKVNIRIGDVI